MCVVLAILVVVVGVDWCIPVIMLVDVCQCRHLLLSMITVFEDTFLVKIGELKM